MVINFKKLLLVISIFLLTKSVILVSADNAAIQEDLNFKLWRIISGQGMISEEIYNLIVNYLNQGADPNWINLNSNPNRETIIFIAIRRSSNIFNMQVHDFYSRVVRALIDHGAYVNFRNRDGLTPLALADQLGIPEVLRQN